MVNPFKQLERDFRFLWISESSAFITLYNISFDLNSWNDGSEGCDCAKLSQATTFGICGNKYLEEFSGC